MLLRRFQKFSKAVTKDLLPTQQATIAQVACGLLVAQSVPQWSVRKWELVRSQEAFEYELVRALRRIIPRSSPTAASGARSCFACSRNWAFSTASA